MNEAAEIASLRQRLTEAEATLRAIQEGEVDALVVRDQASEKIFHLVGDDTYRAFMDGMDLGAAAVGEGGELLYANLALCGLLEQDEETLRSGGLWTALGAAGAQVRSLAAQAANGKQAGQITLASSGGRRQLAVSAAPVQLGLTRAVAVTFTDITPRLEAAAAEESERIGRAVMASNQEAVVVCDQAGLVTQANPAALELLGGNPVGKPFEASASLSFPVGAAAMEAEDLVAIALGGGSINTLAATLNRVDREVSLSISASALRSAGGAVRGAILTLVDLSESKALEKRQALLMRELDHRMKNMLALVMSISTRTLKGSASLQEFRDKFGQRIAALAATQNLLADRAWEGLTIGELVAEELAPFVTAGGARLSTRNLEKAIGRDAAVALGLVLHELVTNAVKYGALSNETGKVEISADPTPEGELVIQWLESGGPPVAAPSRQGFGQTVIARGLGASAAAPTEVELRPEGLVCRMRLAASALA